MFSEGAGPKQLSSHPSDIATCIGKSLSDEDRFHLLTKHYTPPSDFSFPVTVLQKKKRRFQATWLETFKWLVYSPSADGAFCICCALFAKSENLGSLVKAPLKNWNKATSDMKSHEQLKYHQDAVTSAEHFSSAMTEERHDIRCQIDSNAEKQIDINRQVLASIIKTVIFCGRQGLALRADRDDGVLKDSNNSNFNELLKFRIEAGDNVLATHLATCKPNATYVSKTTQNNLINIIGEQIRDGILRQVREAKHFSLLADEATDSGNWEQLVVVLRFVDSQGELHEDFLEFVECTSLTGEYLAGKLLDCLQRWNLNVQDIRGQGYDGAANMAGKFRGVQARISEQNEKALYFHCAAHCLNLCIVKSCDNELVKKMLSTMISLAAFFNFAPKRQRKLEDVIQTAFPDSQRKKMVGLCQTRWVERHTAFETFATLYKAIHDCLGQIAGDRAEWDNETHIKAAGFLSAISSGEFLVAFVVCRKGLQFIEPLTVGLQAKAMDIVAAYQDLGNLQETIRRLRTDIDHIFPAWFNEANQMSQYMKETDITRQRHAPRQLLRENHPAATTEGFFKVAVAIPFLDNLSEQLTERFKNSEMARDGLLLVPSTIVDQYPNGCHSVPDGIKSLTTLWETDFHNINMVEPEFIRWCTKWSMEMQKEKPIIPSSLTEAIKTCNKASFPNLHQLMRLIMTLPITTSECERSVSRLRSLKTYLRSTMGAQRFNGLALMQVHRQRPVDVMAAVDTFAMRFRTKMALRPQTLLNDENTDE